MKRSSHAELRLLMCLPMHCEGRMELPFRQPRYRARKLVELALLSGGDGVDGADAELMML